MNGVLDIFLSNVEEKEFLANVNVPILDGFHIVDNPGTVFTAVNDEDYIEQFLTDGILPEGEEFNQHIEKVLFETKKFMKDSGLEKVDDNISFFKNYQNNDFRFRIYIQDNIINKKIIRQFNAFFIDNDTNAFYQVSFASCPYSLDDKSYVEEDLTASMITTFYNLLDLIKH